ncbi:MAG: class I SAM-dependent methyltransferase [Desulfobacteraceae bacterium]|nr:MAG: class I SAM-dependent methyltransferase [Desulfobacteraceae bacterium]
MDIQNREWEESYHNRDNFLFYPHEEVIRFVSRHIRKRIGLNEFRDAVCCKQLPKVLDLGCGIGRHVIYCHEMGLEAYGIDLSQYAVRTAVQWAEERGMNEPESRIVQGDVRKLSWGTAFFDFVLSHGVLDSMYFNVACEACQEVGRVLKSRGLFYCDLVAGDDSAHAREYSGEEIVATAHEQGTIQSYFNFSKINGLVGGLFSVEEAFLVRRENILQGGFSSRYHLVLRRK